VAQVKAISLANGVQCNGTPTYTAYKALTPFPHLFFDTRIEEAMLATSENISARYVGLGSDHPLHLVFSGRLTLMKGVDHLCLVAAHLRKLGVRFEMSICGDGDWAAQLRKDVDKMDLGDLVRLRGTLDFKTELIPFVTKEAHLFVCCHRQGDPSCTYLETMACGVPIVGYANEALRGLVEASGVGWITAINRPIELAEKIASLYRTPSALLASAHRSQAFAREHTFEKTFRRRVEHLDRVAASALSIRS
jgi:glycosyltransferase involved in cell wall biosynthesis